MTKRIISVTAPDDSVHTRQTDRPYTHAVLIELCNGRLHDEADKHLIYVDQQLSKCEALQPGDDQFSCREGNLRYWKKSLVEAERKLAAQPSEGVTWKALSFHTGLKAGLNGLKDANKHVPSYYVSAQLTEIN